MKILHSTLFVGFFLATLFVPLTVFSNTDNTQLDRIETKVDVVVTTQKKILDVVDEGEPLQGKKYGIEINPFRLLFIDKSNKSLSGSFSFFNVKPHVEISIPFFASVTEENNYSAKNENFYVFTLDGHYRYFLGKRTTGFYISGFSRFAVLHGTFNDYRYSGGNRGSANRGSTYKLGGGFGIGYRVFSQRGFYWGASLSLGRYFIGNNNQYRSRNDFTDIDDQENIIDIEFFKIGYAF